MDRNGKVSKNLERYCKLTISPEYAILLKGSWGCGKTHFINQFIESFKVEQPESKFLLVSLYGISSVEQIEDKFFQQLNPVLSSKPMILASKIGKGLLKGTIKVDLDGDGKADGSASASLPDIKLSDYLTNTKNCILVFDDLERCSMPLNEILGYINYFVEKEGYKTILLADEAKLTLKDESDNCYKDIKEKLIGKTLQLESKVGNVFDDLVNDTIEDDRLKAYLEKYKSLLITTFKQTGYENLRSLRKLFIEFNDLFAHIEPELQECEFLIRDLIQVYTVISMELYAGKIETNDVPKLFGYGFEIFLPDDDKPEGEDEFKQLMAKYGGIISNSILKVEDWMSWFNTGVLDTKSMNGTLRQSPQFQGENAPEWKRLLSIFDLEQDEFARLQTSVWKSFLNYQITDFGGIKHLVGLYLYLAKNQLNDRTPDDTLKDAKDIVLNGFNNNKYDFPLSLNSENDFDSYDGLAYFDSQATHFIEFSEFFSKEVITYQNKVRATVTEGLLFAGDLDLVALESKLCDETNEQSFAYNPVLANIPVDKFVGKLESLKNIEKKEFSRILRDRYRNHNYGAMKSEVEWMQEVVNAIEAKHSGKHTIDSFLMLKFCEWLKPYLNMDK